MPWCSYNGLWRRERKLYALHGAGGIYQQQSASAGITLVGSAYNDTAGGNAASITVDLSSISIAANDIIFAVSNAALGTSSSPSVGTQTPSGYTSLQNGGTLFTGTAVYKKAAGTETDITFDETASSANTQRGAGVLVLRGVDSTTPAGGSVAKTDDGSATSADVPSYTPAVSNEMVVTWYAVDAPSGTFPTDAGGPTGVTVLYNRENSGGGCALGLGYIQHTTGALDLDTWAWGGSSEGYNCGAQGFRPA